MPIEHGDSWFSPEIALGLALEVESIGGRALIGLGAIPVTEPSQTTNGYTYTRESDSE